MLSFGNHDPQIEYRRSEILVIPALIFCNLDPHFLYQDIVLIHIFADTPTSDDKTTNLRRHIWIYEFLNSHRFALTSP